MREGHFRSAIELASDLATRQVSAVELFDSVVARIVALDGPINAVVARDFDRARLAAQDADIRLKQGERLPLLGVPVLIKESFDLAGTPTSWGFPWGSEWIAQEDALPVARLKQAGAIVLGKTNVAFALADWQADNPVYGTTNNPWDLARSPGGSSGGSAAELAAGFAALDLGSDIGGSLRAPAHFCGILAHKPSLGLLPARGHGPPGALRSPFGNDLGVIGPMARTAEDLALVVDLLSAPDPLAAGIAHSTRLPPARHGRLCDFRVLILDTSPLLPLSREVASALEQFAGRLHDADARVEWSSALVPDLAAQARNYLHLFAAYTEAFTPPQAQAAATQAAAMLPADDHSFTAARLRGAVSSHRDWLAADGVRRAFAAQWRELFRHYDVVLKAPLPTPAFPHDHSQPQEARQIWIDDVPHPYLDQLTFAGIATSVGLPATVAPIGRTPHGLPVGVEIIGPYLEDNTPLVFAALLEREFGGFAAPPGY